ncbi:MAG: hypothetical protein ACKV0T_00400 [Planctomycetales bacterium]
MGIVESRVSALHGFPYRYTTIALSSHECEQVLAKFMLEKERNKWFQCDEFDTSDKSPGEVREWLRTLGIQGPVSVVWIGLGEGIHIDFSDFVHFYDDLWFPSSDDVLVVSSPGTDAAVMLSHEELFTALRDAV